MATLGRKGEQRASFLRAEEGSFRSTFMRYRFWSLPLSLIDFFEASPYGLLADSGGGIKCVAQSGYATCESALAAQNGYVLHLAWGKPHRQVAQVEGA